jgi:hypothetical protein
MSRQLRRLKTVLDFINEIGGLEVAKGELRDAEGRVEIYVERVSDTSLHNLFLLKQTVKKGLELLSDYPDEYAAFIAQQVSALRIPLTAFDDQGKISIVPSVTSLQELIWIIIAQALAIQMSDERYMAHWLRRCATCGNLFLQKTKRGSHFCQPRCRWIRDNLKKKEITA